VLIGPPYFEEVSRCYFSIFKMSRHGARGIPIHKEIQLSIIRKLQKNYGSYKGFLLMHPGQHINVLQFNHCIESTVVSLRIRIHHFRSMQIRMGIRIRFRIQGNEDQKQQKIYSQNFLLFFRFKKLQVSYPQASMKGIKATGEASSPQKRASSISKHGTFPLFCGSFLPDPAPHS